MYKAEDGDDEEEPDWVKQEREQFTGYRSVQYSLRLSKLNRVQFDLGNFVFIINTINFGLI